MFAILEQFDLVRMDFNDFVPADCVAFVSKLAADDGKRFFVVAGYCGDDVSVGGDALVGKRPSATDGKVAKKD